MGDGFDAHGLSATQQRALRLLDNRLGEFSAWDAALVTGELAALQAADYGDMDAFGFGAADLESLGIAAAPADWPDMPQGGHSGFETLTFTVTEAQAADVRQALALAKAKAQAGDAGDGNRNSNGNAIAVIARAFLEDGQ